MLIIGCDYHPSVQQIAVLDQETGEYQELRLEHKNGEAERFYRKLAGQPVRVGVEATGGLRWFERLLGELKLRATPKAKPAGEERKSLFTPTHSCAKRAF
jgi:hypothetical protein